MINLEIIRSLFIKGRAVLLSFVSKTGHEGAWYGSLDMKLATPDGATTSLSLQLPNLDEYNAIIEFLNPIITSTDKKYERPGPLPLEGIPKAKEVEEAFKEKKRATSRLNLTIRILNHLGVYPGDTNLGFALSYPHLNQSLGEEEERKESVIMTRVLHWYALDDTDSKEVDLDIWQVCGNYLNKEELQKLRFFDDAGIEISYETFIHGAMLLVQMYLSNGHPPASSRRTLEAWKDTITDILDADNAYPIAIRRIPPGVLQAFGRTVAAITGHTMDQPVCINLQDIGWFTDLEGNTLRVDSAEMMRRLAAIDPSETFHTILLNKDGPLTEDEDQAESSGEGLFHVAPLCSSVCVGTQGHFTDGYDNVVIIGSKPLHATEPNQLVLGDPSSPIRITLPPRVVEEVVENLSNVLTGQAQGDTIALLTRGELLNKTAHHRALEL